MTTHKAGHTHGFQDCYLGEHRDLKGRYAGGKINKCFQIILGRGNKELGACLNFFLHLYNFHFPGSIRKTGIYF